VFLVLLVHKVFLDLGESLAILVFKDRKAYPEVLESLAFEDKMVS